MEKEKKVQTAFRFNLTLVGRLKEAAKMADVSVNEYVTSILTEATKDIESEAEKEEDRRRTKTLLDAVAGKWSGPESREEIMESIRGGRKERKIVEL